MLGKYRIFVCDKIGSAMGMMNDGYDRYSFHAHQNNTARRLLENIESEKGETDPEFARLSKEYARDVLGWAGYAPWLVVYSAMAGGFKEGWIPDNYYGWVVVPKMSGRTGSVTAAKTLTAKLLDTDRLPDIAYYVNGLFYDTAWETIPPGGLSEHIFKHGPRIVYKTNGSGRGESVVILERDSFDAAEIRRTSGGVFQTYIGQHGFFDGIMPDSVATLRLTTVIGDNGAVSCRAAYLRIGRRADTHVKSASAVKVAVDLASGELGGKGYLADWRSLEAHPDTGFVFGGKTLPEFRKCVDFALETHRKNPLSRSIGWDVIVDAGCEVRLNEWNAGHNDIKFSEAAQGPCFADLGWEKLWRENK